jgi:hypothetical protein
VNLGTNTTYLLQYHEIPRAVAHLPAFSNPTLKEAVQTVFTGVGAPPKASVRRTSPPSEPRRQPPAPSSGPGYWKQRYHNTHKSYLRARDELLDLKSRNQQLQKDLDGTTDVLYEVRRKLRAAEREVENNQALVRRAEREHAELEKYRAANRVDRCQKTAEETHGSCRVV